jgi:hypothetical protein
MSMQEELNETGEVYPRPQPILRTNQVTPLVASRQPSGPPAPKPQVFSDIPRYLVKMSSSLFKKATAAEIFLTNMEKDRKLRHLKQKETGAKDFIKVDHKTKVSMKNNLQNLMSEPSTNLSASHKRRKSIEVLMTEFPSQLSTSQTDLSRLRAGKNGTNPSKPVPQQVLEDHDEEADRSFQSE